MENRETFKLYRSQAGHEVWVPFSVNAISCGFPSPADDYIEKAIDLNKEFVKDSACTFFARGTGDSMIGDHIMPGDLLLVDKSVRPFHNCIALCYIDGEFTCKRLLFDDETRTVTLMPSNKKFKPIVVGEGDNLIVWGVVRSIHRELMKK